MIERLTEDNFLRYAMKHYDNPQCYSVSEFDSDLKRFSHLKKLLFRHVENGELRERLILNHIIVIYNLFGVAATNMLFFRMEKQYWSTLTTFLLYLGHMPEKIPEHAIILSDIKLDTEVIHTLRKI